MKKMISLVLAALMICSVSIGLAASMTPDCDELEDLAGIVVNATVGRYNPETKTFTVTLYEDDSFDIEDVEKLVDFRQGCQSKWHRLEPARNHPSNLIQCRNQTHQYAPQN